MNPFEKIKSVADEMNIFACPDVYTKGDKKSWITYSLYQRLPQDFGNNDNNYYVNYLQIHLFLPLNTNFFDVMVELGERLKAKGFCPCEVTVQIESDQNLRHLTYSTSIIEEVRNG